MKVDATEVLALAQQVFTDELDGVQEVAALLGNDFVQAIELLLKCAGKVVVTGMGKSGHIARKIAATLASTGTPAFFVHPAEAMHGDLGMIEDSDVVIAISYSGESDELVNILPALKRKHVPMIGVTGNAESSLAKFSDCVLSVRVSKEACPLGLAPTTTTTATMVLGDAIAVSLLSVRGFKKEDFALSHPGGTLGRRLLITVNDIMHIGERIPQVSVDASLKDVVVEISKKGLGLTGVVDADGKLLGVVTDGDLRRLLDHNVDIMHTKAQDVMNTTPKTVSAQSLAAQAVDIMEKHKITAILVVDAHNKLVGAFNLHDLFKAKLL